MTMNNFLLFNRAIDYRIQMLLTIECAIMYSWSTVYAQQIFHFLVRFFFLNQLTLDLMALKGESKK